MKKILVYTIAIFCCIHTAFAQNNNSPYSIIGLGDIEKSSFDRTSGMGHAGLALSSNRFFYYANPASYATMDNHFFNFEFSARYQATSYTGVPITSGSDNTSSDLQFKRFGLAIKLKKFWTTSIGLQPFSTVNYSFNSPVTIGGTPFLANAYVEGTGNTNMLYITNSFAINKNLSIGVQSSYFFGQIEQDQTFSTAVSDSTLYSTTITSIYKPYFKLGVQYRTKLSKHWSVSAGATGSLKTSLNSSNSVVVKDGNTIIPNNQSYQDNQSYVASSYALPLMYAGGIAATLNNAFTFAADYNYQGWNSLKNYNGLNNGLNYYITNSNRFSFGGEYSKKITFKDKSFFERWFLQTGFFYENSYLNMAGQQIKNIGATFGGGFNCLHNNMGVHAAVEIGSIGTTNNSLIKEDYSQFTLTLSYRDFWFTHMKKYD